MNFWIFLLTKRSHPVKNICNFFEREGVVQPNSKLSKAFFTESAPMPIQSSRCNIWLFVCLSIKVSQSNKLSVDPTYHLPKGNKILLSLAPILIKTILATNLFLICSARYLADPGKARGCSTNTSVIHSLSNGLWKYLYGAVTPKRLKKGASSHKTNYIDIFSEILNPEGHQNHWIGSKVTAILLNR